MLNLRCLTIENTAANRAVCQKVGWKLALQQHLIIVHLSLLKIRCSSFVCYLYICLAVGQLSELKCPDFPPFGKRPTRCMPYGKTQNSFSKFKKLQQGKTFYLKTFLAVGLCLLSGLASTYLLYVFQDKGGFVFPGLLYTSSTVFIFLLASKTFRFDKLMSYYLLMNFTCLTLWFLTFICSYLGLLTGIISGGIGALITFYLTNKFIVPIKYNKSTLFILGGLAFFITEILQIIFNSTVDKYPFEYFFKIESSVMTIFGEVFIFWQIIIGTKLFLTLQKK